MKVRSICRCPFVKATTYFVLLGYLPVCSASAAQKVLLPVKDASIYQYNHGTYDTNVPDTFPKADGGYHLHVGDTNNNNGTQRGLIQFDLGDIPSNAIVTDANLEMTVADVPSRVLQRDINFWMVPMEGLSQAWAEGPGVDQSPADSGDTTWFHTRYDPAAHGQLGNPTDNLFSDFTAGDPGYWPAPGYFGHDDLSETETGAGVGGPFDDDHALVFTEGLDIGGIVNWGNQRMVDDIQAWVDGSKDNFGWIMVGEEWITDLQQVFRTDKGKWDNASSKIDFYSRETAAPYYAEPTLTVTYSLVPEPGSATLLLCASATLLCWRRRKKGDAAL
jgi:hypothetical protein